MKIALPVSAALIALYCLPACADTLKNFGEVRALSDRAMQSLSRAELTKATQLLSPYWIGVGDNDREAFRAQLMGQQKYITSRAGNRLGYVFLRQQVVGNSLARIEYLEKFERHVLHWNFYFYRPKDDWQLKSVAFDDSIPGMF